MVEVTHHQVNGVRLAVRSRSPSKQLHPPMVLLPGTGATATDWDVVATELGHDRTVLAVDLRGHGRSEWPGTYSIDLMADDLLALFPRLAVEVDIVGHSLGGLVACRAAASAAFTPRRLVLEDVGLLHSRPASPPERPEGALNFDWTVVEQVRPEIDEPAPNWPDTLARIEVPTLVIGGGPSSVVPQEHVTELVALVQHGREATIDAGHTIHASAPDTFLRMVHNFLDC